MTRHRLTVAACAALAALVGCSRTPPSPTSAPSAGQIARDWVVLGDRQPAVLGLSAPHRVVSAAPRITEILCAMGLRETLVGRTRYCSWPPSVADVADIGDLAGLNSERLLGLRPDLVLISGASRTQAESLAALEIRVESLPDRSLEDLFTSLRRVDEIFGTQRAAELVKNIDADLRAVAQRYKQTQQRVLLVIGCLADPPTPPFVAGPESFYDELLRRAGVSNAAATDAAFGPLSLEYILRTDPDQIIELDPDGRERPGGATDALRSWGKVGQLQAVTKRRVHVLTGPEHYLIGPRIAQTFEAICQALGREE